MVFLYFSVILPVANRVIIEVFPTVPLPTTITLSETSISSMPSRCSRAAEERRCTDKTKTGACQTALL